MSSGEIGLTIDSVPCLGNQIKDPLTYKPESIKLDNIRIGNWLNPPGNIEQGLV